MFSSLNKSILPEKRFALEKITFLWLESLRNFLISLSLYTFLSCSLLLTFSISLSLYLSLSVSTYLSLVSYCEYPFCMEFRVYSRTEEHMFPWHVPEHSTMLTVARSFVGGLVDFYRTRRKKHVRKRDIQFNSDTGKYHCPNCNNGYGRRDTMLGHYRYECGKAPRYKCPYCHLCSKKTSNIYQHVRCMHPKEQVTLVRLYWARAKVGLRYSMENEGAWSFRSYLSSEIACNVSGKFFISPGIRNQCLRSCGLCMTLWKFRFFEYERELRAHLCLVQTLSVLRD